MPRGTVNYRDQDPAIVREYFDYDESAGNLIWEKVKYRKPKLGSVAGYRGKRYIEIRLLGKLYLAHVLVWAWKTGEWPEGDVDHANADGFNNRWGNLRDASRSQNVGNSRMHKDNVTALKGVTFRKDTGKWFARGMKDGKKVHLGNFDCPAAAHFAYIILADKNFGEYSRIA